MLPDGTKDERNPLCRHVTRIRKVPNAQKTKARPNALIYTQSSDIHTDSANAIFSSRSREGERERGKPKRLAEPPRVKEGPAITRHREGLPRRRVEELLKRLQPPRELLVLAHDGLVPPLEDVDVLRCLREDGSLKSPC